MAMMHRTTISSAAYAQMLSVAMILLMCSQAALAGNRIERKVKGPADFTGAYGEVVFRLPYDSQRIEHGNFGHRGFYAFNIDRRSQFGHFSIEWLDVNAVFKEKQEFLGYWQEFLPTYLAKNFGNGGYRLVRQQVVATQSGRRAIEFVGTGTNNEGGEGTIIGRVIDFGPRYATAYTVLMGDIAAQEPAALQASTEALRALSDSLRCMRVCDADDSSELPASMP